MKPPKGYLPRKGDVITVRATVKWDVKGEENATAFVVTDNYDTFSVAVDRIVEVVGRVWKDGTRVRTIGDKRPGTVVASSDDFVWFKHDSLGFFTVPSMDLEEMPEDDDARDLQEPPPAPDGGQL